MRILVIGGCGYLGSYMVPHLLADGHRVTVYDSQLFGSGYLPGDNGNLTVIRGDYRFLDLLRRACEGQEAVIHLGGLTNNDACNDDPLRADDFNRDLFANNVLAAKDARVSRFIYASSVAVYGTDNADESTQPRPSTLYAHAKGHCENWTLASWAPEFCVTVTRAATICGHAPNMRFDTTVNRMTRDAVKGEITVYGGLQKRAHVHIRDVMVFYKTLLAAPVEKINGQIFNVVAQNQSVLQTAQHVASVIPCTITTKAATDQRSYSVNGEKAKNLLSFEPAYTVKDAVSDMYLRFQEGHYADPQSRACERRL